LKVNKGKLVIQALLKINWHYFNIVKVLNFSLLKIRLNAKN